MVYPHVQYQGAAHPVRELDCRTSDEISVRLLWHPSEDRVSVAVRDAKTGDAFELPVQERERALEVFHHPYAYAARCETAASTELLPNVPSAVALRRRDRSDASSGHGGPGLSYEANASADMGRRSDESRELGQMLRYLHDALRPGSGSRRRC